MKMEKAEKKLREAKFFLDKMRDQERRAFGDKEPFDFYLSAFLNAGTSFRGEFQVRQDRNRNDAIKAWRKAWEDGLSPGDNAFINLWARIELPRSMARARLVEIPVGNIYSDAPGTVTADSGTLMAAGLGGVSGAVICKPAYDFAIEGSERKATDACAEYLALLERMLAKYKADQP